MAHFPPPALLLDSCEDGECAQSRRAAAHFAALDQRKAQTLGGDARQKLFQRSGRNLVLSDVGQLVLSYADEIFSTGRELMNAVKQRPGNRALHSTSA